MPARHADLRQILLARTAHVDGGMNPPPKCPRNPDLEYAIATAWALADMAEKTGRAPSGDIARARDILRRLAR
jgi:hypothetical protein